MYIEKKSIKIIFYVTLINTYEAFKKNHLFIDNLISMN